MRFDIYDCCHSTKRFLNTKQSILIFIFISYTNRDTITSFNKNEMNDSKSGWTKCDTVGTAHPFHMRTLQIVWFYFIIALLLFFVALSSFALGVKWFCCVLWFAVCCCHAINFWRNQKMRHNQLNFQVAQDILVLNHVFPFEFQVQTKQLNTKKICDVAHFFMNHWVCCEGENLWIAIWQMPIVVAMQCCFRWTMCVRD